MGNWMDFLAALPKNVPDHFPSENSPSACLHECALLPQRPGIPLLWSTKLSQDQGPLLPLMPGNMESLIDASEDSQLEAAIRASLQETHFDSAQAKQDSRSDEESESELFSGSEEFISVCGSDEEEEVENLAKSRKSPHKDLGHRKEENRRPLTEPPARTEPGTATNHQGLPAMDSEVLEMSPEKSDGIVEGIDVNGPKAQLMLRYPDGKREQITLPEQAKLLALVKHVQSKGYPNERFELLTNFPRRKLSHLDYDITLQEAGLCPQETVFVQERN
ncbi:UBX domain-containing protein 7 [Rattus norvegicus]|uniref:UBX domain-containing protein 7 n=1 Tax=Rattus norvegicus TaxID=10116 RepID=UPI002FD80A3C